MAWKDVHVLLVSDKSALLVEVVWPSFQSPFLVMLCTDPGRRVASGGGVL